MRTGILRWFSSGFSSVFPNLKLTRFTPESLVTIKVGKKRECLEGTGISLLLQKARARANDLFLGV